jgi:hypothetical protein
MYCWFTKGFDLEAFATRLGLKVKLQCRAQPQLCTFLKGWWQPLAAGGVGWFPLPSQVVKLGKVMRHPRLFSEKKDVVDGVLKAAWAIAQSMPTIPWDYPILGPFLAMLKRNGRETRSVLSASEDGWYKPSCTGLSINRAFVMDSIQCRYGLEVEDIQGVESMMDEVRALPVFLNHVVFERLMITDYS